MKLRVSLTAQAGIILFAGCIMLVGVFGYLNGVEYKALVEKKFSEKLTVLGENCVDAVLPVVNNIIGRANKKISYSEAERLNQALSAVVAREDMLYAAVKLDGRVLAFVAAGGSTILQLPEKIKGKNSAPGYQTQRIKDSVRSGYEIVFPLNYQGNNEGELLIGFNKSKIESQLASISMKSVILAVSGAVLISAILLAFIFLRIISPVNTVAKVADEISRGEVGDTIKVINGTDEIARMTQSFDAMSKYLNEVAAVSESLSAGELTDRFEPKSGKDVLGNSFKKMILYINEISLVLSDIAAGNLQTPFKYRSERDLLGTMVVSMLEGLKELVGAIKQSSDSMAGSSKQLASIASESQATISQLAETIANISQATSEAARNSQTASAAAMKAEASARAGSEKMDLLMEKMAALRQSSDLSNKQMETLGKHSEEIKNMVSIIESVADETKLLSFNAAIEAARAGEAGRGFAVVAEEIRNLSEMSTAQAKKISSRIKQVRDDITAAVGIAQESLKELTEGSILSEEAHKNFADIVASVDEAAAQVENIAASSQQIAASSEEASASSQEQAASMEELNASAEELSASAELLKQMTDKFTT